MAYAEHDFYLNTYSGDVVTDSDTFTRLAKRASEYLDHFTMHRISQPDDAVRLACCAMVDVLFYAEKRTKAGEGREIASESNDGYSVSFVNSSEELTDQLYSAAYRYLSQTGLMDFGVSNADEY